MGGGDAGMRAKIAAVIREWEIRGYIRSEDVQGLLDEVAGLERISSVVTVVRAYGYPAVAWEISGLA